MAIVGYARVARASEQNLLQQVKVLDAAGAQRIFTDNGVSGAIMQRPQLLACLDHLQPGDVLTVWKLDRLGRNTRQILEVIEALRERHVGFRSLTENLDTTGPAGAAMLAIMAAVQHPATPTPDGAPQAAPQTRHAPRAQTTP
ncbi:recombinase family protein [Diaminobutyricibacter tongyongensis]|uniref:Recombinase family protein n=1 Tax=Leifsonia tongyongensis TaxID=1268043 RepID=A0A6L9Y225_9MICO|nr:recombinase family protein [Diaminobutyricibacter tongyongensis]